MDNKGIFEKLKDAITKGELSNLLTPPGKLLISNMAAGLTEENLKELKEMLKEGKIEDKFRVKKGVPFAPSILIGVIVSIFIGDLVLIIQKIIYSIFIYI